MSGTPRDRSAAPTGDAVEVALTGGNASDGVVRLGDTVRKPWTAATPLVHGLLGALRAGGLRVPAVLGRDESGRQVLEHVPGDLAMDAPPLDLAGLARVGAIVRRFHDVAEGRGPGPRDGWSVLLPPPDDDAWPRILCHHDLAPWNLVLGESWVFIDWDGAGPSTRPWDLAYAAQTFTLDDPAADPAVSASRLAALVDGYDPDGALRAALPEALVRRPAAMRDHLARAAATGFEPWATMHREGHGEHWGAVADHVARHRRLWAEAVGA